MSDFCLVMPTAGEYRVVESAVHSCHFPLELRMCGVGPGRAAALCAELEREARPQGMALLGWAGGLLGHLTAGDIVIATEALSAKGSDVDCVRLGLPGLARVYYGAMLTSKQFLATPEAKRSAAKLGALAVEMEAYPLAAWASDQGVSFVHGRVILDTLADALPELDRVLDGYGRLQLHRLPRTLAARPAVLGDCARLALRLRSANRRLAELAQAVLAAWLRAA